MGVITAVDSFLLSGLLVAGDDLGLVNGLTVQNVHRCCKHTFGVRRRVERGVAGIVRGGGVEGKWGWEGKWVHLEEEILSLKRYVRRLRSVHWLYADRRWCLRRERAARVLNP